MKTYFTFLLNEYLIDFLFLFFLHIFKTVAGIHEKYRISYTSGIWETEVGGSLPQNKGTIGLKNSAFVSKILLARHGGPCL